MKYSWYKMLFAVACGMFLAFATPACSGDDVVEDGDNDVVTDDDPPPTKTCDVAHHTSQASAITIAVDDYQTTDDWWVCSGETVYFKFTLTTDQVVEVELDYTSSTNNLDLEIVNATGDYVGVYPRGATNPLAESYSNELAGEPEFLRWALPGQSATTYYIKVVGDMVTNTTNANDSSKEDGQLFSLTFNRADFCTDEVQCTGGTFCKPTYMWVEQDEVFSGSTNVGGKCTDYSAPPSAAMGPEDGDGSNDSYSIATAVDYVNTWASGDPLQIAGDDIDVFKYTAASNGTIDVMVYSDDEDLDLDILIYVDATTPPDLHMANSHYAPAEASAPYTLEVNDYILGPAGDYYFYVGGFGRSSFTTADAPQGNYSLEIIHTPATCSTDNDCYSGGDPLFGSWGDRDTCSADSYCWVD